MRRLAAVLAAATVALGGFSAYAFDRAGELRNAGVMTNTALTDNARTSEVKGAVVSALQDLFSCDYTDLAKVDRAAKDLLVGGAPAQYERLFGPVRTAAAAQGIVLTTTITDSAVRSLQDGRARVLVFADQASSSAKSGKSGRQSTMMAVDAVRQGGRWKIAGIDTFTG
ncbi:hypothetical protein [Actinocorallia longicatena]|uniref:Mce-associated membrane protein n=1 Tax=Actinocorallia longicatena TaxID=111803 RepID=A0ABP6QLT3_9ACTN